MPLRRRKKRAFQAVSLGIARVFLGCAKAARRQARARVCSAPNRGCQIGGRCGRLVIVQVISFPASRLDVHGPPSSAGFGISRVLGSAAP